MSADVTKHLERAKKYLEKNKLQDAVEEYRAVLKEFPNNQEAVQALGDLYTRLGDPHQAAQYYGMLFDRLTDSGDTTRAAALYSRFLKSVQQSPDRMIRFAHLLQRQGKRDEAVGYYNVAGEEFLKQNDGAAALNCWEKIAALDPENPERHIKVSEVSERLGKSDVAARGWLRAGQLTLAGGEMDRALDLFSRAYRLSPGDRSVALLYAEAFLRKGAPQEAVRLLEPFPAAEGDAAFLTTFGAALMQDGQLDRARAIIEQLYKDNSDSFEKMFELADQYLKAGKGQPAVELFSIVKDRMFAAKRQNEFTAHMDKLLETNPTSLPVAEFCGRMYDELNRESKYFNVLTKLFDLYLDAGNVAGACSALDRVIDIDPYDQHNHERMRRLEGKADPAYLRGVGARMGKIVSSAAQPQSFGQQEPEPAAAPQSDESRARQALEDLIVQAEIFLQYSLQAKAIERLQKIGEMFPGEEENNQRLRSLFELANWWPPRAAARRAEPARVEAVAVEPAASRSGTYSADTLRDLGKISEITRTVHRQSTPKAVLSTAVNEIGKYLKVTRCLAVVGPPGQPPQMASEYCAPGVDPSGGAHIVKLLGPIAQATPDEMGAFELDPGGVPALREMGLECAMGVQLTDRETQAVSGFLVVGNAVDRPWKPNESYFLQAVGDQVLIGVNHTKLRSLMRTLAVADEKTGLLGRGSYQDCLLSETNRMKSQSTPLSLVILSVDKGMELLRQHGEPQFDRHMEQLARSLQATVRQNDLAVKYTSWALAFVLPDTKLADACALADKLRKVSANVRPPWNQSALPLSASVVEAVNRPDYDAEDIVTDLINRAEFGLEEARKKGGDAVLSL
ncbi:MAG: tetratricopeptide repeat protein [Acidobacteria bacterium]|nr:tetratricopeptide repeat protein [Acidobacteriota bacterium]MBI3664003.1 tetratricopeptide repeat protein [Acidobacteriota bacterium]